MSPGSLLALFVALASAAAGGLLLWWIGMPLAWMLGALFGTAIAGNIWQKVHMPHQVRDVFVPVLGVLLGSSFTPALLEQLPRWPAGVISVIVFAVLVTAIGRLYFMKVAKLDPVTAFFASSPGGLGDLTLIGAELGANLPSLATIHTVRILVAVLAITGGVAIYGGLPSSVIVSGRGTLTLIDVAILIGCGVVGSGVAWLMRIPAGAMIGPMIVSGAVHLAGITQGAPPGWLVAAAQIVLGAFIGTRFIGLAGKEIRPALLHGLIWAVILMLMAAGLAELVGYFSGLGFTPMLLALAPGGFSEMAVITLTLGIDVAFVSTCHMMRLFAVYAMVPVMISLSGWRKRPVTQKEIEEAEETEPLP